MHRLPVPMSTADRRKLGIAAAERMISASELARVLLHHGLDHIDEIVPGSPD